MCYIIQNVQLFFFMIYGHRVLFLFVDKRKILDIRTAILLLLLLL